jgi:CBS domain-containing protein
MTRDPICVDDEATLDEVVALMDATSRRLRPAST